MKSPVITQETKPHPGDGVRRSVWLPKPLYDRVRQAATKEDRTAGAIMRRAIHRYVEQEHRS